jgi:hypothetical protein
MFFPPTVAATGIRGQKLDRQKVERLHFLMVRAFFVQSQRPANIN